MFEHYFNELNRRNYSIEDWQVIFEKDLTNVGYSTTGYGRNPHLLYRARINKDSENEKVGLFQNISELWAPPAACVKSLGRCNQIGQSTLYCATEFSGAVLEILSKADVGDFITVIEYEILNEINPLLLVGWESIIRYAQAYRDSFSQHYDKIGDKSRILDSKISEIFRREDSALSPIYNITNAVYNCYTFAEHQVGNDFLKINGIIYPSVIAKHLNYAFVPELVQTYFNPKVIEVFEIIEKQIEYDVAIKQNKICCKLIARDISSNFKVSGEIIWSQFAPNKIDEITGWKVY